MTCLVLIQLLDLGAGDGQITATLAQLYADVSVTEASCVSSVLWSTSLLFFLFLKRSGKFGSENSNPYYPNWSLDIMNYR